MIKRLPNSQQPTIMAPKTPDVSVSTCFLVANGPLYSLIFTSSVLYAWIISTLIGPEGRRHHFAIVIKLPDAEQEYLLISLVLSHPNLELHFEHLDEPVDTKPRRVYPVHLGPMSTSMNGRPSQWRAEGVQHTPLFPSLSLKVVSLKEIGRNVISILTEEDKIVPTLPCKLGERS